MSDKTRELEQELGLTSQEVKMVPNIENEQLQYLIDDAKTSIDQINEVIDDVKTKIDGLIDFPGVDEEGKRNDKSLNDIVETYSKLMTIKQKYATHLMDIYKRKKTDLSSSGDEDSGKKSGMTSTEIKQMIDQAKPRNELF